ncbi:uncharacterized protein TNCV_922291 [Trichonephila clavipes]|nr:uncharacterized protein TNCV_922291 [Trichonephila clavipes]
MVWDAIAYNTLSPLVLIRVTVTTQRYVHDILQPHVLPLMQQRLPGATRKCSATRRRAASPLVRLVEGEERWETPNHPQGVLPLNWGETEPNRFVTCMVLKASANDRRHLDLGHDEFRGP